METLFDTLTEHGERSVLESIRPLGVDRPRSRFHWIGEACSLVVALAILFAGEGVLFALTHAMLVAVGLEQPSSTAWAFWILTNVFAVLGFASWSLRGSLE